MKTIVFVVSSFYPNYSAVGVCAQNVIDKLKKNHHIIVITLDDGNQDKVMKYQGITIYNLADNQKKAYSYLQKRINETTHLKKNMYRILLLIFRTIYYFKILFSKLSLNNKTVKKYLSCLESINKIENIDMIVSCCMPFETIRAGYLFKKKNPDIFSCCCMFDPFADNQSLHRTELNRKLKFRRHIQLEKETFLLFDKIIAMPHLESFFKKNHIEFMDKIKILEHPTMIIHKDRKIKNNTVPLLIYAGSLNKGVREPNCLLDIFCHPNIAKCEVSIYTSGNMQKYLNNRIKNYSYIKNYGFVCKELIDDVYQNSNILISIGNLISNQAPSKTYEYIGYGKPILHIYYDDNDSVLETLSEYPYTLFVDGRIPISIGVIEQVNHFIHKVSNSTVDFEFIKNKYRLATPEVFANFLISQIKKGDI